MTLAIPALTYHSDLSGRQAGVSVPSNEQWRPVPGFEDHYEVSDDGQVRSLPRRRTNGRILSQRISPAGYPLVTLKRDGEKFTREVHRLVTLAFVGARPDKSEVRHLDGDPTNNHLINLQYGTCSENHYDMVRHGTHREAAKTHCKSGHPFDEANTRHYAGRGTRGPQRVCRTCERAKRQTVAA